MKTGLHHIPFAEYLGLKNHLSNSGIKRLLSLHYNGCPAKYRYYEDNPEPPKKAFDIGSLVHKVVLGEGSEIQLIDFDNYKTKAAQEEKKEAYEAGRVPVLPHEMKMAEDMAEALKSNADAMNALHGGLIERSLIWESEGVKCKCRPDSLNMGAEIIADYKTTTNASFEKCTKAINDFGYNIQAAMNIEGAQIAAVMQSPTFLLIFQEKEPPYLSNVLTIDPQSLFRGEQFVAKAKKVLRECIEADQWPGYYTQGTILAAELPPWLENKFEAAENYGYFEEGSEVI